MSIVRSVWTGLRNTVLPRGSTVRRIPLGLASGLRAEIDFHYDSAFFFGWYEAQLNRHLRALVKPGYKCFDIGAYRGWHALILAKLCQGPVATFDANKATLSLIERNAKLNEMDVRIVNAYVGNEAGCMKLDEAAASLFMPDFIKMDIEGAEDQALAGAERILSERGPAMIIEVHGKVKEDRCQEMLKRHGYKVQIVDQPGSWVMREQRSPLHNRWLVCAERGQRREGHGG